MANSESENQQHPGEDSNLTGKVSPRYHHDAAELKDNSCYAKGRTRYRRRRTPEEWLSSDESEPSQFNFLQDSKIFNDSEKTYEDVLNSDSSEGSDTEDETRGTISFEGDAIMVVMGKNSGEK